MPVTARAASRSPECLSVRRWWAVPFVILMLPAYLVGGVLAGLWQGLEVWWRELRDAWFTP